ncbi:MAG: cytosine permease [Acidobacteria bacterium]|jgi:cytosine permease|nr:cytosine permease [Acidobacteriota bacterium]
MSNETTTTALPNYITSAMPNPAENRAPWFKNTAPTYAGIFLWFVFWQDAAVAPNLGGTLAGGVGWALISLVVAALICHFFFYLVPGLLGQKTGLPLYIVGTSTYGAQGGFIMPGFLMGLLQFGWLGVNIFASSLALNEVFKLDRPEIIMVVWGVLAAFVGLKGIQYVGRVATYLPLIPLAILLILFFKTIGSVGGMEVTKLVEAHQAVVPDAPAALSMFGVLAFVLTYVVGFFATAGAAGVDFGTNSRDRGDVQMGGLVGIALAILLTAGLSTLIVAGVYGSADMATKAVDAGKESGGFILNAVNLIPVILGATAFKWMAFLLALAAFPAACFSSFIAANSFKTTLPKVNPFLSVGIGAAISIVLAVTGLAGRVVPVFVIIGASFGPICGAMFVDYLMNKGTWTGPRAGFNPAGWIAWAVGFVVGILPNLGVAVPAAPVLAFVAGALVYWLCAKAGLLSPVVPLPSVTARTE